MSLTKIIVGLVFFVFIALVVVYGIPQVLQQLQNGDTEKSVGPTDPLVVLQDKNEPYAQALSQIKAGNYADALVSLESGKALATTPEEHANIDFAIADVKLNLNRSEGIDAYSALALDTAYPERTRALSLLRAFLMYKKFNDVAMLQQIAENHSIKWTIPEQVTYEVMRQIADLHAFPYAQVKMLEFELLSVSDNLVAQQLFNQQNPLILASIESQKPYSGERTELTSAMLGYANLLSQLYFNFSAVSSTTVSAAYEDLIEYDIAQNIQVNKQYTMLAYANFLAGNGQFDKADRLINLLLEESLTPALQESLPKTDIQVAYPYLYSALLPGTLDEKVKSFISSIGNKLN